MPTLATDSLPEVAHHTFPRTGLPLLPTPWPDLVQTQNRAERCPPHQPPVSAAGAGSKPRIRLARKPSSSPFAASGHQLAQRNRAVWVRSRTSRSRASRGIGGAQHTSHRGGEGGSSFFLRVPISQEAAQSFPQAPGLPLCPRSSKPRGLVGLPWWQMPRHQVTRVTPAPRDAPASPPGCSPAGPRHRGMAQSPPVAPRAQPRACGLAARVPAAERSSLWLPPRPEPAARRGLMNGSRGGDPPKRENGIPPPSTHPPTHPPPRATSRHPCEPSSSSRHPPGSSRRAASPGRERAAVLPPSCSRSQVAPQTPSPPCSPHRGSPRKQPRYTRFSFLFSFFLNGKAGLVLTILPLLTGSSSVGVGELTGLRNCIQRRGRL